MSPHRRHLRLLTAATVLAMLGAVQPQAALASNWGSSYGDPAGFCPAQSRLPATYSTLVTNDPLVGSNPEQATFYGYHPWPGYDDWYGYWYGDFRGRPGDASGWQLIHEVNYPDHWHWNFADWGWAVHGHAKQYIAYYNWTFGGQCGMGWYGSPSPAPYMADVDGFPVLDIYVDSVPPALPRPRVSAVSTSTVSFTWDPVADLGDGSGPDYFAVGFDHFTSWLTIDGGAPVGMRTSPAPLVLSATATPSDLVCVHVTASDRLGNTTRIQWACARPAGTPPAPAPPAAAAVRADPPTGLAGLPAWLWLDPAPTAVDTLETVAGIDYRVVAQPVSADWDFGDGSRAPGAGFGAAYPAESDVQHAYDAYSEAGRTIAATVHYSLSWWYRFGGDWVGPYPMDGLSVIARPIAYPVRQAQPELQAVN